jgi:hypothetical protein
MNAISDSSCAMPGKAHRSVAAIIYRDCNGQDLNSLGKFIINYLYPAKHMPLLQVLQVIN